MGFGINNIFQAGVQAGIQAAMNSNPTLALGAALLRQTQGGGGGEVAPPFGLGGSPSSPFGLGGSPSAPFGLGGSPFGVGGSPFGLGGALPGGGGFGMSDLFPHGGAVLEKSMRQLGAAMFGLDEQQLGSLDGASGESSDNAGFRADDNRSRLLAQNNPFLLDHRQVGLGNQIDKLGDYARAAGADHVAKPLSQLSAFLFGNASKTDTVNSGLSRDELGKLSQEVHGLIDGGVIPPAMRGLVEKGVAQLDRALVQNLGKPEAL